MRSAAFTLPPVMSNSMTGRSPTLDPAPPITRATVRAEHTLDDYAAVPSLAAAASELKAEARRLAPRLAGGIIWFVSSTATGGGVAEMLPPIVGLLRDLGINTERVVIGGREPGFFLPDQTASQSHSWRGRPPTRARRPCAVRASHPGQQGELRPLLRPGIYPGGAGPPAKGIASTSRSFPAGFRVDQMPRSRRMANSTSSERDSSLSPLPRRFEHPPLKR